MEAGARDLLRRFSGGFTAEEVTCGDSDEIELGLSLGGCFSSQDAENSRLVRTSSIPAVLRSDFTTVAPLVRACSMPSETEEEIRRRKEMQCFKRMEAKRKREEKRNSRRLDEDFEGESVGKMRRFEVEDSGGASSSRRFGLASLGSVASQGSNSSGGSEFESQAGQGFDAPELIRASSLNIPSKMSSTSEHTNLKASSIPSMSLPPPPPPPTSSKPINGTTALRSSILFNDNDSRKNEGEKTHNGGINMGKNMMEEMPSVSTKGEGPNGRRIEGFLYRYRKGEVSIVCVCHGSFLTPAEFVKHAGGGDVAHPLRHIVVNPSHGFL